MIKNQAVPFWSPTLIELAGCNKIINEQPGQIFFTLDVLGGCINNRSSWTGSYILTLVPE